MNIFGIIFSLLFPLTLWSHTIHVEGSKKSGAWTQFTSSEELNFQKLFELLSRSAAGEKLIKEARFKAGLNGQTLADVVKVGDSSLTDTTLVRKFSPQNPSHVVYESRSVVYINRDLNWHDAILDLAHELTHFVYRGSFNPYAENFNPTDFIRGTIEGEGGEVQAFLVECRVLRELFSKQVRSRSHCQKIENEKGELSFSKAVELFYHVGHHYAGFKKKLDGRSIASEFKELSDNQINFISSAYGVPYPLAAMMEYEFVISKVCENDKKRLAYMQQGPQRTPASIDETQEKFQKSYRERCSDK